MLTLLMLVHYGEIHNYNAPLSQIVKLQNKVVCVINDVSLMESVTPHYISLGLLKFPDIVLN